MSLMLLAYFSNGQYLVRICFNAALGDDVAQKLVSGDPKGALFWV
jgi:hypothetical protein